MELRIVTGLMPDETLDWVGFSARFFPERRRHDLEALYAYGVYRKECSARGQFPQAAIEVWEGEGGALRPHPEFLKRRLRGWSSRPASRRAAP